MKKIAFNDTYGLTQAVLDRRKMCVRKIARENFVIGIDSRGVKEYGYKPMYRVGEIVAVAQSYKDIAAQSEAEATLDLYKIGNHYLTMEEMGAGWNNKMFVRADIMPNQIRITNVRLERLQEISDEDCIKEGLEFCLGNFYVGYNKETGSRKWLGKTPREAYAALIDKVSGNGIWESNPLVFVYDFKLVK